MTAPLKIVVEADDVTDEILRDAEDALDWFEGERLETEAFIDRLARAGCVAEPAYDFEQYDNPAIRKIMRHVRAIRREQG